MYFFQRGLLDGSAGFLLSVISAYYTFLKYAELWVMQRSNSDQPK
jgi:(heptosyl)LPS beta-1,4-glucosyltransferase